MTDRMLFCLRLADLAERYGIGLVALGFGAFFVFAFGALFHDWQWWA